MVEYDETGKAIWSVAVPGVWSAVRLANGNTLACGKVTREINPKDETVWKFTAADGSGGEVGDGLTRLTPRQRAPLSCQQAGLSVTTAPHEMQNEHNERNNQQQVNETARDMQGESPTPQHEQKYRNDE